ncbi:MAG TPA: TetR/AcrR family transcriptional regulator [Clostridiales bacterium]|nr:TetR/AcrR family transcriptional regulator [Clostridiales bacterium]
MARNKYPEVTVDKILDVSKRLFIEKGFDNTTIQDIVDELGGLTKGAIYHHFKSKEEIMKALGDKMFFDNNPFEAVKGRADLNGLQKIRMMLSLNRADAARNKLNIQAIPILENPRILAAAIEANRKVLTPLWFELIDEGTKDGSIQTEYAKELSEFLPFINFWLLPSIFPATAEELQQKNLFVMEMLSRMGLPLADEKDKPLQ